jgi:hypothetical protein
MEMNDPPVPLKADPVTVTVPKLKEYETLFLRGISFANDSESSSGGKASFTVNEQTSEVITKVCQGHRNLNKNGKTVYSCLDYFSKIHFEDKGDRLKISLHPYKAIGTKAHDDFFIPHDAPRINVEDLRRLLARTNFSFRQEYESQYTPEAIKANFDRHLKGTVDQDTYNNTRQFANSYRLDGLVVRANFYPHKSGSAIQVMVDGKSTTATRGDNIDWATTIFDAKKRLATLVNN